MDATSTAFDLAITDAALTMVREAMAQQDLPEADRNLRLFVESGGGCCGGMSFGIAFDSAQEHDQRLERGGIAVLVDPVSAPYLNGAEIDFVETADVTGFKVTVPQPEAPGCASAASCGSAAAGCPPDPGACGSAGC